jgi:uncharacterized protein involved in outer membrane biogenesis
MKKFTLFISLLFFALGVTTFIAWKNKENVLAHFLSKQLRVPLSLGSLEIHQNQIAMSDLWIGNPHHSKTNTSFSAQTLSLNMQPGSLLSDPLIIPSIDINDAFIGLEYYNAKGTKSNWDYILQEPLKMKSSRKYLIKTLTLRNLNVEVTQSNGVTVRYPTIKEITLYNISDESGFPIEEIQKAIFKLVLKEIFKKLPLDQLFKNLPLQIPSPF